MERYKIHEVSTFRFLQVPKIFLGNDYYKKNLNSDAKLLYALILDRMSLSRKNNWANEKGEVYIILTREEASELLGISYPTASKAFKQLVNASLIEEVHRGNNKPKLLYIGKIMLTEDNFRSGPKSSFGPDQNNLSTINTDLIDTERNILRTLKFLSSRDSQNSGKSSRPNYHAKEQVKEQIKERDESFEQNIKQILNLLKKGGI